MSKIKNYIFDLDGTIINSSKEVLLCFEKAFAQAEYPIDKSRLTPNVIGPPLKEIIQSIAPEISDEDNLRVENIFHRIYDFDENDISVLFDGMMEFLQELKSDSRLFMATFKPTRPTLRIIKQFNLDMFEDIYTIDKFGAHITKAEMIKDIVARYGLKKEETVMIGDAASDVIAAKTAGVKGIGVIWGYGDNKKPLIENADVVVGTVAELSKLIS